MALVALALSSAPLTVKAQSVRLNQYRPAELLSDSFVVRRPEGLERMRWLSLVSLDYAYEPLVFEYTNRPALGEKALVRDQLDMNLGGALGVGYGLSTYVMLNAGFVLQGDDAAGRASGVNLEGVGLGDVLLGGRWLAYDEGPWALGAHLALTLPTAHWVSTDQQLRGEQTVTAQPELLASFRHAHFRVDANLGGRFRGSEELPSLTVGQELTFRLGLSAPIPTVPLAAAIEVQGTAGFEDFFSGESTPLELFAGTRYSHPEGIVVGFAGSTGLTPGYGAPNLRVLALIGYQPPE